MRDSITTNPDQRSGQPCIRGMRIAVRDVLESLAGGMTVAELLADFPELTARDVRTCPAHEGDRQQQATRAVGRRDAVGRSVGGP